jgi:hypothetical protein
MTTDSFEVAVAAGQHIGGGPGNDIKLWLHVLDERATGGCNRRVVTARGLLAAPVWGAGPAGRQ